MFTGHVTELSIYAPAIAPELRHGDSVAISGACQTVTFMDANSFKVQMMPETLARTKLGGLRTGARVNLERAMRLDTRIDGHLVAGHVDGVAEVSKIEALNDTRKIYFTADERLLDGIVEKGSVTIDGVSLTVIDAEAEFFSVGVIPTTLAETTIARGDDDRRPPHGRQGQHRDRHDREIREEIRRSRARRKKRKRKDEKFSHLG